MRSRSFIVQPPMPPPIVMPLELLSTQRPVFYFRQSPPAPEKREPVKVPKYFYFIWGGLSAGVHVSAYRDVASTLAVRNLCTPGQCQERFALARPFFGGGSPSSFHGAAQAGAAAVNVGSLLLLMKAPEGVKVLGFFVQAGVIIATNVAANRNRNLERRLLSQGGTP